MSKFSKFLQYTTMVIGTASVLAAVAKPIIDSTATKKDDAVLDKVNTGLLALQTVLNAIALNPTPSKKVIPNSIDVSGVVDKVDRTYYKILR